MDFEEVTREIVLKYEIPIRWHDKYYHATSSNLKDKIMKEGVCSSVDRRTYGSSFEDAIFLSTFPESAWAEDTCDTIGGKPGYFIILSRNIIKAGCKMYPDYGVPQPVDRRGRIILREVCEMMLLECTCVKVDSFKYIKYKEVK